MDKDLAPVKAEDPVGDTKEPQEPISLTLAEETLDAKIVERQQGEVVIHKRVETQPMVVKVDLHHDDFEITEVDVNEEADERRQPWYEGETLMVPVYEEVVVARTQLMLRQVIQLKNRKPTEQVNLKGTVRREVLEIMEPEISENDHSS